jgi:hypothetical protein
MGCGLRGVVGRPNIRAVVLTRGRAIAGGSLNAYSVDVSDHWENLKV